MQLTSNRRVKKENISDSLIQELYNLYITADLEEFRRKCEEIIAGSSGSEEKKQIFLKVIGEGKSKDFLVKKVTNYFLAGEGRGV